MQSGNLVYVLGSNGLWSTTYLKMEAAVTFFSAKQDPNQHSSAVSTSGRNRCPSSKLIARLAFRAVGSTAKKRAWKYRTRRSIPPKAWSIHAECMRPF